jgi:segregation and condensation protein B
MVIDNIQVVEALLFASEGPLTTKKIREVFPEIGTEGTIKKLIGEIDEKYATQNSPYKIIELAGGFQIVTRDEFSPWIVKLYKSRGQARLTRKGLETLAIIAYKQPITKLEVEKIRGVNADGVIRTLAERNLITVSGREKAPGNPLLYGTTNYFLEYFGLKDISHLPKLKEIDELLKGDVKFLESLDQVALDQMMPEVLGLSSLENDQQPAEPRVKETIPEKNKDEHDEANPQPDAEEQYTNDMPEEPE